MSWYQLLQLAFAALVILVIIERVRALHWQLASSDETVRWLARELRQGRPQLAHAWAQQQPRTQAARLLLAEGEAERRELQLDLRDEAGARLVLLRVAATLGSTLGLLGGILLFTGALKPDAGLLALQAGAVEKLVMQQAITTMAIGVATSGLCFQALGLLRPAAQSLIAQGKLIQDALGSAAA